MLKISEVVQQMGQVKASGSPKPFTITFVKADRHRKTAGEVRTLEAILPPQSRRRRTDDRQILIQPARHKKVLITVHLDLILYFNSEPVA